MAYEHIQVPAGGKISITEGKLNVPDNQIVPFIEGDGTGRDIWRASVRVLDAAVEFGDALDDVCHQFGEFLAQDVVVGLVVEEPGTVVVFREFFEKLQEGGNVHG